MPARVVYDRATRIQDRENREEFGPVCPNLEIPGKTLATHQILGTPPGGIQGKKNPNRGLLGLVFMVGFGDTL
jgi:hypothetical protein